jgi:NAD(P)-dependent dehydrogenase (short-subunit alcohol dehydrogenase family)
VEKRRSGEVIVVGSGVIGLTTAVVLAERGRRVRVWAREPAERTTSAVAGALWWPYRIEPEEFAGEWALASLSVYAELAQRPEATGVRMVEGVQAGLRLDELGPWAARVPDLRETDEGLRGRLPLIDMPVHLGWLRERFLAAGGAVEERSVEDLSEAAEAGGADVVVNCTGIGAREPVAGERRGSRAADFGVIDLDRPAARAVVAADAVEERGLASAIGADEAEDLTRLDRERHVLQHFDAAELQTHFLQCQLSGHAHLSLRCVAFVGRGSGRAAIRSP